MKDIIAGVPEIFYDLIGRVIPGGVCTIAIACGYSEPTTVHAYLTGKDMNFFHATLIFGLFYIVGITLDLVGSVLEMIQDHWLKRVEIEGSTIAGGKNSSCLRTLSSNEQWKKVRKEQAHNNYIGLKIRAEILFFRSLAIISLAMAIKHTSASSLIWVGLALIFLFACWRLMKTFDAKRWESVQIPWEKVDDTKVCECCHHVCGRLMPCEKVDEAKSDTASQAGETDSLRKAEESQSSSLGNT